MGAEVTFDTCYVRSQAAYYETLEECRSSLYVYASSEVFQKSLTEENVEVVDIGCIDYLKIRDKKVLGLKT